MDVELIMMKSDGARRTFQVKPGVTVIGRTNEADLRVPLPSVSRRHCEVTVDGDVVRMRDLGSSNGTLHNNVRVEEATLAAGDQLTLGPVSFLVRINGQPAEVAMPTAPEAGAAQALAVEGVTEVDVSSAPTPAELPVAPEEDPLAAMAAAAVVAEPAQPSTGSKSPKPAAPAKPVQKPQVIPESEVSPKIEAEFDSPTVDLDDPISALERLAAEQAALEGMSYMSSEQKGKKKDKK